jgi:acyl homoserine lactone synthase
VFEVLSYEALLTDPKIRRAVHFDRMQQFHDRHGWAVSVTCDGLEIDQFDASGTTYCMVRAGSFHHASLRLRDASDGNMVEQAFGQFWANHGRDLRDKVEVTRLVSSYHVQGTFRQLSVAELLLGMCRHSRKYGQPELFGVVFPSVARTLKRIGWEPDIIDSMDHGRSKLLLARWTASAQVDWALQETIATLTDRVEALQQDRGDVREVA